MNILREDEIEKQTQVFTEKLIQQKNLLEEKNEPSSSDYNQYIYSLDQFIDGNEQNNSHWEDYSIESEDENEEKNMSVPKKIDLLTENVSNRDSNEQDHPASTDLCKYLNIETILN